MTRLLPALAMTLLFTIAACSRGPDDQPGTVTADEARQLNEAAEMLDANSVDLNAIDPGDTPDNESDPI
ncbi:MULTISPECIES: hypothetical protein [unclassified Sphingomonas]|jgi:hypothetical protein|uniref:hypothetical protein n=1 Tax=unclassified Sphingomonas TaxID=196159 RepID=UPI000E101F84|nr:MULTISPECIES: hypothetical protein [unclassified Sphingomonas]AXJ94627.1 hypothetical protein DM480_03065 [Sphingomonas sp. FARSPH]